VYAPSCRGPLQPETRTDEGCRIEVYYKTGHTRAEQTDSKQQVIGQQISLTVCITSDNGIMVRLETACPHRTAVRRGSELRARRSWIMTPHFLASSTRSVVTSTAPSTHARCSTRNMRSAMRDGGVVRSGCSQAITDCRV
jgi:hypothetical protein